MEHWEEITQSDCGVTVDKHTAAKEDYYYQTTPTVVPPSIAAPASILSTSYRALSNTRHMGIYFFVKFLFSFEME